MRHVAQVFSLFTITVSASVATWNSVYSMPASLQIAASSSLIGREASERSVSPAQKRSKPPPVPEMPTVTWTSGATLANASAAAVVSGPTVDEPSASIEPERLGEVGGRAACSAGVGAVSRPSAAAVVSPELPESLLRRIRPRLRRGARRRARQEEAYVAGEKPFFSLPVVPFETGGIVGLAV